MTEFSNKTLKAGFCGSPLDLKKITEPRWCCEQAAFLQQRSGKEDSCKIPPFKVQSAQRKFLFLQGTDLNPVISLMNSGSKPALLVIMVST